MAYSFYKNIIRKIVLIPIIFFSMSLSGQDTIFIEMFDYSGSALPDGWTNDQEGGSGLWRLGVGSGLWGEGVAPMPDSTACGEQNLYFHKSLSGTHITKAITPVIDTEFAVMPQLSFYYAQVPKNNIFNRLAVYVRKDNTSAWVPIANYTSPTIDWVERFLIIPDTLKGPEMRLAFQGYQDNPLSNSVSLDAILILDIDSVERELSNINTYQASTNFIPSNTNNNPILQTEFRVTGNDGILELQDFTVNSLNTDDNDIKTDGVKLYYTIQEEFHTDNLLASGNFDNNGEVVFNNLGLELPTGYSYVWVTYDVDELAGQEHVADAYIPANGIIVGGQSYPEENQSPLGFRTIFRTIFYDDFETDKGWLLSGEWEIDVPLGEGGDLGGDTEGNPGADYTVVGSRIMGTDITGIDPHPGNYEPGLEPKEYEAVSPVIDCYYYNNISLSFQRWLNIAAMYEVTIDISTDGGNNWDNIWYNENPSLIAEASWQQMIYSLEEANRESNVQIRFTLGDTGPSNLQSGWNIDQLFITGSYVERDIAIVDWLAPLSSCGLSDQEEVFIVIQNKGAEDIIDDIPVGFSLDDGETWHMDTIWDVSLMPEQTRQFVFEPKADFLTPGWYSNVIAKAFLPEDQDNSNDEFMIEVFSIPTYQTPYYENFSNGEESDNGFWSVNGDNVSLTLGVPSGTTINAAYDGNFAWITNPYGPYNLDEFSYLESPCFDFSDIEDPVIEFSINVDTQHGLDGAALEYSLNEGISWVRAVPRSINLVWNWHDETNVIALEDATGNGAGWSGATGDWDRVRLVLPEILSGESAVKFRFIFASQNNIPVDNQEGVAFDAVSFYETPYDVGVTDLIEPDSDCALSEDEQISIEVTNFGIRTLPAGTIVPAGIDINEDDPIIENFELPADLEPNEFTQFSFSQLYDFSLPDDYNITAYTLMPGDTDFFEPGIYNDTLITNITVYGFPEVTIWHEDTLFTTQPDTIVFDAGEGFVSYLWQDNSVNQTYSVTSPNTQLYSVIVTDENGCQASDQVLVYTRDLEITDLISPISDCEFAENQNISISITNVGYDPFEAGYEIPLNAYFETISLESRSVVLDENLNPGENIVVEFDASVNMSEFGEYAFYFSMGITDAELTNNTKDFIVYAHGYPALDLGDTIYTLQPDTVELDAGEGMDIYEWQDGYNGQIYYVSTNLTQIYSVLITDEFGCSSYDEVLIVTYDLEVSEIIIPEDQCEFTDQETLTVRLTNTGLDDYPEGFIEISVFINDNFIVTEEHEITVPVGVSDFIDVEFAHLFDLTEFGDYNFRIEILNSDANNDNNEFLNTVIAHGYPVPYLPEYTVTDNPVDVVLDPGAGFASYLWNDGSTSQYLDINDWGTYSVIVTNDFGCEAEAYTIVVPETFDPALDEIVSPLDICYEENLYLPVVLSLYNVGPAPIFEGSSIDLFYSFDGQSEISETITLSEDFLPDTYLEYTFDSDILMLDVDSYFIEARIEFVEDDDTGNNMADKIFEVFPVPVTALPDTIITDNPLDLVIDAGDGFVTYLWGDGWNEQLYYVDSEYSQWYTVTVEDANSCKTTDSVFVITYDWLITDIVSPMSDCILLENEIISFIAKNTGHDTFYPGFEFDAAFSINEQSYVYESFVLDSELVPGEEIELQFAQTSDMSTVGDYNVEVLIDIDDTEPENNVFVTDIENSGLPVVNLGEDIGTNMPDTISLDAGSGFESYTWQDGYGGQIYDVQDFGLYWVEVADIYNCTVRDTVIVSPATSLDEYSFSDNMKVYPNPANTYIIIERDDIFAKNTEFRIIDMKGKVYRSIDLDAKETKLLKIDIRELNKGIYLIKIISGNNVVVLKFTKM